MGRSAGKSSVSFRDPDEGVWLGKRTGHSQSVQAPASLGEEFGFYPTKELIPELLMSHL